MFKETVLGIDLGGTHIRGGLVKGDNVSGLISRPINSSGSAEEVLEDLFNFSDSLINESVSAIGIGIPGLTVNGLIYDVVNIPSWKELELQALLQERYQIRVAINNDSNCFALGEYYFGKGKGSDSMLGLTIGTGLGSGMIINKKLYSGKHCGAGEFGMIQYLDHNYEYYASGQFFTNVYGMNGETVYKNACEGNTDAIKMYHEMGSHLGNAIKTILYAMDVPLIVLGGSVKNAYSYFSKSMWDSIRSFEFKRNIESLRVEVSELQNSGILGAAALPAYGG